MKLLRLETYRIRGLSDRVYSFTEPRTGAPLPVALITGAPASGKTTLLDAIAAAREAAGPHGAVGAARRFVREGTRDARITTTWLLSEAEQRAAGVEQAAHVVPWAVGAGALRAEIEPRLRRVFAADKTEYFPADRRVGDVPRMPSAHPSKEAMARVRGAPAGDKYTCLTEVLRDLATAEAARVAEAVRERGIAMKQSPTGALGSFDKAITALLPDLRLAGFDLGGDGRLRLLRRTREVVCLGELSHSEREAVIFALAFSVLDLSGALLLIDEPELHIHAAARVSFLQALVSLRQDNQIIAATGAAEIQAAASPGQVFDLSRTR